MKDALTDRVRATTILVLLHPRSQNKTRERRKAAGETS
jgi:hypothetical protein